MWAFKQQKYLRIYIYIYSLNNKFILVRASNKLLGRAKRKPVMPVASKPRNFVMGKRWVTLVWSKSLSCKNFPRVYKQQIHLTTRTHSANGQIKTQIYKPLILTGTFFWVTTHTESFPRTPIEVIPADFTALKAYSIQSSKNPTQNTTPIKFIMFLGINPNGSSPKIKLKLSKQIKHSKILSFHSLFVQSERDTL